MRIFWIPCLWFEAWKTLETLIENQSAEDRIKVAVIPAEEEPSLTLNREQPAPDP